jgi:hypothetical protein
MLSVIFRFSYPIIDSRAIPLLSDISRLQTAARLNASRNLLLFENFGRIFGIHHLHPNGQCKIVTDLLFGYVSCQEFVDNRKYGYPNTISDLNKDSKELMEIEYERLKSQPQEHPHTHPSQQSSILRTRSYQFQQSLIIRTREEGIEKHEIFHSKNLLLLMKSFQARECRNDTQTGDLFSTADAILCIRFPV